MKYFFSLLCALFLCACAVKNESQKAQSMQVLITSSSFKINEVGFLKSENSTLSLELYKFAKPFFKLNIKKKICLNGVCYAKKEFNHNSCGFTQELHHKDSVIKYEVCEGKLHFKDEISGLKIIIRRF